MEADTDDAVSRCQREDTIETSARTLLGVCSTHDAQRWLVQTGPHHVSAPKLGQEAHLKTYSGSCSTASSSSSRSSALMRDCTMLARFAL